MKNNYPNEQQNQHEQPKFSYVDYIEDTLVVAPANVNSADASAFVEIEMSRSIGDMRREFRRTVRQLRHLNAKKESMATRYEYQFERTAPTRIHLAKKHAVG